MAPWGIDERPNRTSPARLLEKITLKQTCRQAEAGRMSANSTMTTSKPKLATRKIFFLHLVSFETSPMEIEKDEQARINRNTWDWTGEV